MCGLPGNTNDVHGGINFSDPLDLTHSQARRDAASASKKAEEAEAARQARISGNVKDVNSAFDNREGQYAQFSDALRSRLNEGVGIQRDNAKRQSKFALARGGLTGGSAANDANEVLNRESREATLAAERQVQSGVAGLRGSDEDARSRMIALAQSGNDIGNAQLQTTSALNANFGAATNATNISNLGDLFANTAQTYRAQQDAAARRRGLTEAQVYSTPGKPK